MRKAERRTDLTGRTYKLTGFQFEGAVCGACPLRPRCVAGPGIGRTVLPWDDGDEPDIMHNAVNIGLVSLALLALTNGPETSTDADWVIGDDGITHSSTVYYDKDANPFVAYVDKVYWGARPAKTWNGTSTGPSGGESLLYISRGTAIRGTRKYR